MYIKKSIYILHYPNHEKVSVSYGIIHDINKQKNWEAFHLCSTDKGSSGSPILNINNNKLIGIHRGSDNKHGFNKGIILIFPFKEFISKRNTMEINIEHKQKFILKNKVKKFIYQPSYESSIIGGRLDKELKNKDNDNDEGYQIFGFKGMKLYGVLEGPPNTPYEYGFFQFTIEYSNNYPFSAPKFYFQTKIYHPNIDINLGLVSIDILQDQWSPNFTFDKIIYSVQNY